MSNCWSCGKSIPGGLSHIFTCPDCAQVKELKGIRESNISGFNELARIQERGFEQLGDGLAEISSALEWGFEEISWRLHEQTTVLKSIDHTLKTPRQTEAKELREMAEQLRNREDLIKSEEFFLQALEFNPLDYRTYIGLHFTYLKLNKLEDAKHFLEKSLQHAPKGSLKKMPTKTYPFRRGILSDGAPYEGESERQLDYRSYSYRLIGRIHYCKEEYPEAIEALNNSVQLSSHYYEGQYDLAQYCALLKDKEVCTSSLRKAILGRPLYFYLAQKEKNFESLSRDVDILLLNLKTEAHSRAANAISKTEITFKDAKQSISSASEALLRSSEKATLESPAIYKKGRSQLRFEKDKIQSGDYRTLLESMPLILQSRKLALEAKEKAEMERELYEDRFKKYRVEKRGWLLKTGLGTIFMLPILGFIGATVGVVIGGIIGFILEGPFEVEGGTSTAMGYGGTIGMLAGIGLFLLLIYLNRPKR